MKPKLLLPLAPALFTVAAVIACGTPPPPANQPSSDPIPLTDSSNTGATPKTTPAPDPPGSAAPAASASAPKAPKPAPAGTPMVVSENEKEVTAAYSVAGGIIRIGGTAELTLTRESLGEMYGFTFGLNSGKSMLKITPYRGQIGDVYRIFVFRENASTEAVNLATAGPPFTLKLPIKGAKTANLVIATAENGKAKYTILAPKSVLTADTGNTGVYELNNLPGEAIFHLTSVAPTP